ncbi:MAG: sulfatase-like hydrolase/transferase, partial [Thermoanaerobaculia bacterium]
MSIGSLVRSRTGRQDSSRPGGDQQALRRRPVYNRRVLDALSCRRSLPAVVLVFGALCACEPASDEPAPSLDAGTGVVAHDLVREFSAAVSRHQVAKIDLGTPAARSHLLDGWGEDEKDAERPFLWSLEDGAELEFFVAAPIDITAVLYCRKLAFDGAPPQIVSLAVNGEPVGEVEVGPVFDRHRVEVAAAVLRPGVNRLRLGHGYHRRPAAVIADSEDRRSLAVQWYSIAFEGLAEAESPRLSSDDPDAADGLELPAGSEISYYLRTQPGDELVIGDLTSSGNGSGASLRVRFETGEGSTDEVVDGEGKTRPIRWPLPVASPGFGRLTLTAVREPGRGKAPVLSLLLPMVMREREPDSGGEVATATAVTEEDPPPRPPIIIYLIDALRADHLGAYGYHRPTSPNIDRFARDGIVFTNAQAQSSWTRTAVTSLFTGLLPQV